MSESSSSEYVDQFSCPVCLDLLKEPVTIPYGHSYCMSCISDCWSLKEHGPPYRCPQCRESFSQRPLLKKNTLIAEMMETLQKTALQAPAAAAVDCDVCTTEKNRAVKSCLQCLASFCQTHLQPHYESPAFMKHKLVDASRHIQENICPSHGKPLEIYCQDDHRCICCLCTDNHKGHNVVYVDSEWTSKKKVLEEIKLTCVKLIEERERGQQELSEATKQLKSSADEAVEKTEKVFTELICSLQKKRSEIKEQIRAQEKTETDRAEQLHQHLHQELTQLRKTQAEIHKLITTEDQIHCLKNCNNVLPTFEEVPSFTPHTHLSFEDLSFSAFREALEDACRQQTAAIYREVSNVHAIQTPEPKTHNAFLQYFCQLQLDLNTAHKQLKLSEDNRKISGSDKIQQCPDPNHPERFDGFVYVMCKEGLTGRCYWEVECSGNEWVVAVSYRGIGRKGRSDACRLGSNINSWRFSLFKQNFFFLHNNKEVRIPVVRSSRIGVYLDHSAGILSFYSISDTMTLLHRVQTTFTEPLYPAFLTGNGSSVTITEKSLKT